MPLSVTPRKGIYKPILAAYLNGFVLRFIASTFDCYSAGHDGRILVENSYLQIAHLY